MKREWTKVEIKYLKHLHNDQYSDERIAQILGRTVLQIKKKLKELYPES
jgi:hypothetical protein